MAVGAKIAKTADRKKVMDTSKSTDCPKCGKSTRIVKRMKDRQRGKHVLSFWCSVAGKGGSDLPFRPLFQGWKTSTPPLRPFQFACPYQSG